MNRKEKQKAISPFVTISKEIRLLKTIRLKTVLSESQSQEIDLLLESFEKQKIQLLQERAAEKWRHRLEQARIYQRELSSEDLRKTFISQGPFFNINKSVYRG